MLVIYLFLYFPFSFNKGYFLYFIVSKVFICISPAPDSLEGLLSQLSQQINTSDWLKQNTPEKFAAENPEVAKAFQDVASEKK